MSKVCLITGVGPGTGSALARRFATGGYKVAMLARSDDRLRDLEGEIEGSRGYPCSVTDRAALESAVASVRKDLGNPEVLVHNAVGGIFGEFLDLDPEALRVNFEINTIGLLNLAQLLVPAMLEKGSGTVIATGNTSAHRGRANFSGFAPTKAAQRILCESMARSVGPKGIHVAYVTIDAVIDLAWTRVMAPDAPDEFFIKPEDIADECFHVAHQPKSAWSFNVEVRPFGEKW